MEHGEACTGVSFGATVSGQTNAPENTTGSTFFSLRERVSPRLHGILLQLTCNLGMLYGMLP